jgi:membrane protein implicated in regulation of membrane protease activity
MTFVVQWWHWLALGLLLVGAELLVPSFTIFWFGLGAGLTGLVLLLFPGLSLTGQLALFAFFSAACTVLWFRVLKPRMADRSSAGMSREAIIGEPGTVIKATTGAHDKGRVRFVVPLLGSEEWPCICSVPLQTGDQVRVTGIEGHVLTVEKL